MSELQYAVADVVRTQARDLVRPIADQYEPAYYAHRVVFGMSKDKLVDDGSMEEYCGNCITLAIAKKRKEYLMKRRELMGKIYELLTFGVLTDINFKEDKEGNVVGNNLEHIRPPKHTTRQEAVKDLEKRLKKDYSVKRIFSSESYSCGDSDGGRTRFEHCEGCGVTFAYYIDLTGSNELDYFEELTHEELVEKAKDPQGAYELMWILDYWNSEVSLRIGRIATKLINAPG